MERRNQWHSVLIKEDMLITTSVDHMIRTQEGILIRTHLREVEIDSLLEAIKFSDQIIHKDLTLGDQTSSVITAELKVILRTLSGKFMAIHLIRKRNEGTGRLLLLHKEKAAHILRGKEFKQLQLSLLSSITN